MIFRITGNNLPELRICVRLNGEFHRFMVPHSGAVINAISQRNRFLKKYFAYLYFLEEKRRLQALLTKSTGLARERVLVVRVMI